ncbi:MAG TPA: penicillin acylase family protein [Vicinamibacterales bacterium]|nr:penicillin acylase family protein [Vicinamibacterales bacterium]
MRRLAIKALAAIVVLILVAAIGAYGYARQSLPVVDGAVTVAGASAPVDIVRDADAIPHIFAKTRNDALFGLGYAHAQDRLWQMEFQRRIGNGRLSEIFGVPTINQDRFLRTVGFGRAARSAWNRMPGWAKGQVNAYCAGVNAFIASHHGRALPPEFSLLRFEPEPWTGPDVIVWVKMMAWDLSANYSFELLRHDLARVVGPERMAQLLPPYPHDGLSITQPHVAPIDSNARDGVGRVVPDPANRRAMTVPALTGSLAAGASFAATNGWAHLFSSALAAGDPAVRDFLTASTTEALGSNNWVVDGTLTASGKPLLANDPHLGTRLPSTWYLAHLSAPDFDVIGATLPGTPAVALGRNRFIAWGATNVAADVEDLFREKIDPSGKSAEFEGHPEPIAFVPEDIIVKDAPSTHVEVHITRHGPIISDAVNAINADDAARKHRPRPPALEPLAFRWTALDADDSTLTSFLELNEARTWTQFTSALRDFVVPSQNFVYADVDGHIGYYAPGRIPIRASGDGSQPADGSTGAAEWTGCVPFDDLPHLFDPPDHFIVTANHRPAPADYRYNLGLEWVEPYRAQRIVDLLERSVRLQPDGAPDHKLTPDDFARIQSDTFSLHAKALVPLLVGRARPESEPDRRALDLVRRWTFNTTADSGAAAIFQAWFHALAPAIAGDDLGPMALEGYQGRFTFVTRFVIATLAANDAAWCDDATTAAKETCDEIVTKALHEGVVDLTRQMGGDMNRWRWDAVHRAVFPHAGLDAVAALRPLLSRSVPIGGDWATVDVAPTAADRPYEAHTVPGYREIIDLSPANDSRFIADVGESGHVLSPHYDDFLADWRAVTHRAMRMDRAAIEKGAIGTLTLNPGAQR